MNITLLANRDIASLTAVNYLIEKGKEHKFDVLLSARVGSNNKAPDELQALQFAEQKMFNDILFPALDTAPVRSRTLNTFSDLQRAGISVTDVAAINSDQGQALVSSRQPDLIVSIRFGQILQKPVIDIPPLGVINLHSGILPDYRGVMATFWAMLAGKETIGTTLHFIQDSQIDAGDIITIDRQPIDYNQSYLANVLSLYAPGIDSVVDAIHMLANGEKLLQQPVDVSTGCYYSFPNSTELAQFTQAGHKLFTYADLIALSQQFLE